jgi:ubiquinone/menaquinone biosynthesis C-methylase UbiE
MTASWQGSQTEYIHGYEPREQERLIAQAEFWREKTIVDGTTTLVPGTRLLDVGVGVGAVLAILGESFPGVRLYGVDIAAEQLAVAHRHLASRGLAAELAVADGAALPYPDDSFDHVWMTLILEHMGDPIAALQEARRVLAPGGEITCIEWDYSTIRVRPTTPLVDRLVEAVRTAQEKTGCSDAGSKLGAWLAEAGFTAVDPGERPMVLNGPEAIDYLASVVLAYPDAAAADELRPGLDDLIARRADPGAYVEWTTFKASGRA